MIISSWNSYFIPPVGDIRKSSDQAEMRVVIPFFLLRSRIASPEQRKRHFVVILHQPHADFRFGHIEIRCREWRSLLARRNSRVVPSRFRRIH
jgi:hypothetical protein